MEPENSIDLETEIELLRRIGKGDRDSFAAFYDRFSGVLFATALRIVKDPETAEDVLQEAFLQIWDKAPTYDPTRGKPLTWAVTLTRHKAIDRLRATQRRARLGGELERESQSLAQFDDHTSLEIVQAVEKGQLLRAAMGKLSPDQREAIELAFFSGLTQMEIADRLREPLGTVKARIRRGMIKLREILDTEL